MRPSRDDFTADDYNGNDGTQSWLGPWQEFGDDGSTNYVDIESGVYLQQSGDNQHILLKEFYHNALCPSCVWTLNKGIMRAVDLSTAGAARLTFTYRRSDWSSSEYVMIEASTDNGNTWGEVGYIGYSDWHDNYWLAASFDLSAFRSSKTLIRFRAKFDKGFGEYDQDFFYLDNVQVLHNGSLPTFSTPSLTRKGSLVDFFSTYSDSRGTLPWETSWVEVGDDNSSSAGTFSIKDGTRLAVNAQGSGKSIQRAINLKDAENARFTLMYQRNRLKSDNVTLEISPDGGKTWDILHQFNSGHDKTSMSLQEGIDLSPYANTNAMLRFSIEGRGRGSIEMEILSVTL